jgi:hypothetical protein
VAAFFSQIFSALVMQLFVFPISLPLLIAGGACVLIGVTRDNEGLDENRGRLLAVLIAHGVPALAVLLYGMMTRHSSSGEIPVSREDAAAFISTSLWLQLPVSATCAWWCRNGWLISLGTALVWTAFSLGAGVAAWAAVTGPWN